MRCSTLLVLFIAVAAAGACGKGKQEAAQPEGGKAGPALATLACAPAVSAMPLQGRDSPYDSTMITVGQGQAKICYGRPSLRGRTMIGGKAVPYDTLWRTGANEPTIIHLNVPARIAGIAVQPGSYSLYTIPRAGAEWTLIVNRSTSQWGIESDYTAAVRAQEVGRAAVAASATEAPVEQFTIRPAEGGLALEWQNTRVLVPVQSGAV